jgi:hypothetical protein
MVVGASVNVAERAGRGISADATIGMNGKVHDTAARTFAARLYSRLAYSTCVKRAFHQACDEIGEKPCRGTPQFFFRRSVEPRKVVVLRPGGGDPP